MKPERKCRLLCALLAAESVALALALLFALLNFALTDARGLPQAPPAAEAVSAALTKP